MKIGITGHQNIGSPSTVAWVKAEFERLVLMKDRLTGVTSLAAGADQLFADVVLRMGHAIEVVIPCQGYEGSFQDSAARERYEHLLARAIHYIVLPFDSPSEQAFYDAGKRIVDASSLMIAVWNGKPAAGLGGTGDVVRYIARQQKSLYHINPETRTTRFVDPQ